VDGTTLRAQLKLLRGYDTETQAQMLDQSIQATWQGLFPLKNNYRPATRQSRADYYRQVRQEAMRNAK
jgi:hypothetical protein